MIITDFEPKHIDEAAALALACYNEERGFVSALPDMTATPELSWFADNGCGTAAFDGGKMIGFLGFCEPWDNAFGTAARGTFSPVHAHAAVSENRGMIYKRLYQAAAEKLTAMGASYYAISFYAHDAEALNAMFSYGFGMRCIDAIRTLEPIAAQDICGIICRELSESEIPLVRGMRAELNAHLEKSPCFMASTRRDFEEWLIRAEKRGSRLFAAEEKEKPIAFIEVAEDGENFITETESMRNICGAYCASEYRGKGVFRLLLGYVVSVLGAEEYKLLGVDFESFNPTAYGFWLKHFEAYTSSVTRRVDECALPE